jgi:hypothetical protein
MALGKAQPSATWGDIDYLASCSTAADMVLSQSHKSMHHTLQDVTLPTGAYRQRSRSPLCSNYKSFGAKRMYLLRKEGGEDSMDLEIQLHRQKKKKTILAALSSSNCLVYFDCSVSKGRFPRFSLCYSMTVHRPTHI